MEPGGSIEETAKGEVFSARPGSRSRAEAWDGSPGNLRGPARAHGCDMPGAWNSRLTKCSRPGGDLTGCRERFGEHERGEERVGPATEENKGPGMRGREVVAPSYYL